MTTAFVTDIEHDLGREVASHLTKQGWTVFAGRSTGGKETEFPAGRTESCPGVHGVDLDVTSDLSVQAAFEAISEQIATLDVIVHTAGIPRSWNTEEGRSPDDFAACFETNVAGAIRLTRVFLPLLHDSSNSRLIFVSTGSYPVPTPVAGNLVINESFLPYPETQTALEVIASSYRDTLRDVAVVAADPGPLEVDSHNGGKQLGEQASAKILERLLGTDQ